METRNSVACDALAGLFQDMDGLFEECNQRIANQRIAAVFRKMAEEELRHVEVLTRLYQKQFGPPPATVERGKTDHKTLEKALAAGLCRLVKENMAEKRRENRFTPKWAAGLALGFTRWVRRGLQYRSP